MRNQKNANVLFSALVILLVVTGAFGQSDGVDGTYTPVLTGPTSVSKVAIQPDGKSIIWGDFDEVNGTPRPGLARLNVDGSLDTSFDPGTALTNGGIIAITVQGDGKILIGGDFASFNGTPQLDMVRLNSDGSVDTSFDAQAGGFYIAAIAIRPDGKILVGGYFGANGIALLNSDGTRDATFNPMIDGGDSPFPTAPRIESLLLQPDGKIMIGGIFIRVNGVSRANLTRLNSDGTLDGTYTTGLGNSVSYINRLSDGKYIVRAGGIKKINSNGTVDNTFTPPSLTNDNIRAILVNPDDTILVGGMFDIAGPVVRKNIVRLRKDGTVDITFRPYSINNFVRALAAQPDGKILAVGDFTQAGNLGVTNIARLSAGFAALPNLYDFDGDGKSDFMVTRPADYNWHLLTNGTYNYTATHFGAPGDKVVPADYDGDGKTDVAIWRPSTGDWWWKASSTGAFSSRNIGTSGDTPVPSDTDGDGKTDLVVVTSGMLWKGMKASTGELIVFHQFGQAGDKPVIGDFDRDGKFDMAYFRPSNGTWYYNKSSSGANLEVGTIQWGLSTDIPAPADYDGDGKTDVAVYRPSEGNWYVLNSGGGYLIVHFGATGDKPVPADYDGDGKADVAVFRPSDGYWYQLLTTGGYTGLPWGISSDIPAPNALLIP
jgi:uncharacterized delta-60 repeat protein